MFCFQNNISVNKYEVTLRWNLQDMRYLISDQLLNQTEFLFFSFLNQTEILFFKIILGSVNCLSLRSADESKGDHHWHRLLDKPGKSNLINICIWNSDLIFVTNITNYICGEKSVMWRNLKFLYITDV